MSTEREPQICTLPDYCPGCTERVGQEGGCYAYESLDDNYKAYQGQWSNLKRCKEEVDRNQPPQPAEANFYIGVYVMDSEFASGDPTDTVSARLKVWWDATSAAPRSAPVLLALVAAFVAMFN